MEKMKTFHWVDAHQGRGVGSQVVSPPVRVKNLGRFLNGGSVLRGSVRGPGLKADRWSRELRKQVLALHLLKYSGADAKISGRTEVRRETNSPMMLIVNDSLGKPEILCGTTPGPSVSFAHMGAGTWGAICPTSAAVGIDVERAEEFSGGYPFSRAFCEEDVMMALHKTNRDEQEAAALLWSAKEAIVKAIGCGFHLLDPIDVSVAPWFDVGSEHILRGHIGGGSLERLPISRHLDIPVSAVREENAWVCTALLDRHMPAKP